MQKFHQHDLQRPATSDSTDATTAIARRATKHVAAGSALHLSARAATPSNATAKAIANATSIKPDARCAASRPAATAHASRSGAIITSSAWPTPVSYLSLIHI